MELLFVVLGGALLGFVAHFALPAHDTRGVLLAPAAGAAVAAVVWEVLLLAGLRPDGGWIWVVALLLSGVAAVVVCRVAATVRRRRDGDLLARLTRG
ncbi:hypothetical protein [Frigoribacterium sp. PvP032]|uniref:hypothetical protein n=1 Tax=Frigoribacterium sp. PvP032 TaxID=2806589 RepID=UPI001AE83B24|nr:hypothetical protein [Frigoribacterium sp. PvP032]MBP1191396.1 putative membrane protein YeaQ/YmgE (transglycosylase-associated protein family) [Frigoribacterium sp. PvP032]